MLRSERVWLWLVLALAALAGLWAVAIAYYAPLTVQDDARQFVFWMAEWRDEAVFRGDLLAEYWRSVSPWLYVAVFRAADLIGLDPITATKLLPAVLFPATAFFAYRFAQAIFQDPRLAYLSILFLLMFLVSDDGVVSSTPRAFAPLFLLIFLDGLARRSVVEVAAGLFCLAGTYPQGAMVAAVALAVIFFDFSGRPRLVFTKANFVIFAVGAVAAVAGVAPMLVEGSQFGPVVTPETAKDFATFAYRGRTSFFDQNGRIDLACHPRMGVFPKLPGCEGWTSLSFWLVALAVVLPPALVFIHYRKTRGASGSPIPLAIVLASVVWFAIAAILAFKLHLPNRFLIRTIPIVSVLCLGAVVGTFLQGLLKQGSKSARLALFVGGGILIAVYVALFATQHLRHFQKWKHPLLAEAVASYPVGTVFAGFVEDTDNIPLFTERRVLFSTELAVAYHLGYYRQVEARLKDMVVAEFTPDASVLAERLGRNGVGVYLVDERRLADPDRKFTHFLGSFVDEQKALRGGAQTALSRLAPACSPGTFDGVAVLDAHCLIAAARQ
jgi:hypothetical protein